MSVPVVIGSVVGSLAGLSLIVGGFLFWMWRRQKRREREELESQERLDLGPPTPNPETTELKNRPANGVSGQRIEPYVRTPFVLE